MSDPDIRKRLRSSARRYQRAKAALDDATEAHHKAIIEAADANWSTRRIAADVDEVYREVNKDASMSFQRIAMIIAARRERS